MGTGAQRRVNSKIATRFGPKSIAGKMMTDGFWKLSMSRVAQTYGKSLLRQKLMR
jgi:hypothetical protein